MIKQAVIGVLVLGVIAPVGARGRDILASFEGGIGVVPVSSGAGAANTDGRGWRRIFRPRR